MSDLEISRPTLDTSFQVRRALNYEPDGVAWVIEHFTPMLLAQARYRMGRDLRRLHDPEDLVHNVWLLCLSDARLETITPRDGRYTPVLLRFLSAVLLRQVNNLKARHLAGKLLSESEGEGWSLSAVLAVDGDAARTIMRRERASLVSGAIASLGPEEREILILRGFERVPYEELSQELAQPLGTLRSRFHHALRKLREVLPPAIFSELEVD